MTTGTLIAVGAGHPEYATDGATVTYSAPAGCVLRRSADLQTWQDVTTPSPFVHTGEPAHYRIDCDTYAGTPITATLAITGA